VSLNWKEIDAVLQELDITGSRIQKIRQPNFRELVFETYAPGRRIPILISLESGRTRLHAMTMAVPSEVKLQRFSQLLRSRILGGKIVEAGQIGKDRIIHLSVVRSDERTELYIRLWSGAANIIATDENFEVLDAFYRRPAKNEVSGCTYHPDEATMSHPPSDRVFEVRDFPVDEESESDAPAMLSLNRRVEYFYRSTIDATNLSALKTKLLKENERERTRLANRASKIKTLVASSDTGESYKRCGDLITSNLYKLRPGATHLLVDDYYHEGVEIEIEIDPNLSGGDNADRYYNLYKDRKKYLVKAENELSVLDDRLTRLDQRIAKIEASDDIHEIQRLAKPESQSKKQQVKKKEIPGLQFRSGAHTIYVGRSSRENDELLRNYVRGNDLWMHTRDVPGGYVFVRAVPGKSVPLEVLLDAGNLAVYFSKAKSNGRADLFYTQVKYLRRAQTAAESRGSRTNRGLVLPTQEKNLAIELEESRIARMFA
jgi:predicted ribosome quality control (RQC) complex YloA/Tae2 family protein